MRDIGVVIPTYNHATVVTSAIDSVLAQTSPASEIIVVDDGSTDDTSERLRKYSEQITHIYQPNLGLSAARNRGVAECQAAPRFDLFRQTREGERRLAGYPRWLAWWRAMSGRPSMAATQSSG